MQSCGMMSTGCERYVDGPVYPPKITTFDITPLTVFERALLNGERMLDTRPPEVTSPTAGVNLVARCAEIERLPLPHVVSPRAPSASGKRRRCCFEKARIESKASEKCMGYAPKGDSVSLGWIGTVMDTDVRSKRLWVKGVSVADAE